MPKVECVESFINELKKYTGEDNIIESITSGQIVIEETEDDGKGEVYINTVSPSSSNISYIKIKHCNYHTIGNVQSHNDGIILKIDFDKKEINVLCFELKKQLRFNKLEKAAKQLTNAYRFINYLQLDKCFQLTYKFYIAYESNNLEMDSLSLKTTDRYNTKLFQNVQDKTNKIPLQIPFCRYEEFDFEEVIFGNSITI